MSKALRSLPLIRPQILIPSGSLHIHFESLHRASLPGLDVNMDTRNHYQLLELKRDAGLDDIKAAYRQIAKRIHPDKNPGSSKATAEFQKLQAAYSTLSNASLRQQYDRQLESASNCNQSRPKSSGRPPRRSSEEIQRAKLHKLRQKLQEEEERVGRLTLEQDQHQKDWHEISERGTRMEQMAAEARAELSKYAAKKQARQGFLDQSQPLTPEEEELEKAEGIRKWRDLTFAQSIIHDCREFASSKLHELNKTNKQLELSTRSLADTRRKYDAARRREQKEKKN